MRPSFALRSLAVVTCVACGDSKVTEPEATPLPLYYLKTPTNDGDGQSDTALATLASPFRVLVRRGDMPAPGVTVLWEMPPDTSKGIPRLAVSTVTNAVGIASYTLTLGPGAPYTYAVRASLPGVFTPAPVVIARGLPCGSALCFTATAKPGKPTSLRMVSGDNQTDTTNAQLSADYVVQATDRHGNGVAGVVIDWTVTDGGGSITPMQNITMPTGYAAARHTLGSMGGPQSVTAIASGLPAAPRVTFTATVFGSLLVTTTMTGVDPDLDGYAVYVDGATRDTNVYFANAATTIARLLPGEYRVTLHNVVMNCEFDLGTPNPRSITVSSGMMAALEYDIRCAPPPLLAFHSWDSGEIYTIRVNGVDATRLTNGTWDAEPAWSPDGSKIAFTSRRDGRSEIYVMNADGSNPVRLTYDTLDDGSPAWSPDGTKIAFSRYRNLTGYGSYDVFVMDADGTNVVNLTNNRGDTSSDSPTWSPDGTKIAFGQDGGIVVMNADGTGRTSLALNFHGGGPSWSPDGTKIAYISCYATCNVVVVHADGSNGETIHPGNGKPAWSRDGRWIAVEWVTPCFDEHGNGVPCDVSSGEIVVIHAPGQILPPSYFPIYQALSPGIRGSSPTWRP
jgi:TolB protein